jgi:hypothetical protein
VTTARKKTIMETLIVDFISWFLFIFSRDFHMDENPDFSETKIGFFLIIVSG